MKKRIALLMTGAMVMSAFGGITAGAEDTVDISGQSIEVATYLSGDTLEAYKTVIAGFEEEYGVTVELDEYGSDYESTMKTRMAADSLPDVFETHGWSLIRYKEYLKDLSDEPWADQLSDAALGVIADEDGSFYTLMTTGSCLGIAVNLDVCEAAGVDAWEIETWEDFNEACQKIKDAGYTPVGNYFTSAGALANEVGTFLNYEGASYDCNEAMLDGSWEWEEYYAVLDYLQTWFDNDFLYEHQFTSF